MLHLLFLGSRCGLASLFSPKFGLLLLHFEALLLVLIVMLQFQVHYLLFMRLLLLFQLLAVVFLELGGEFFTLLVLNVHLPEVHFKLPKKAIDRRLILLLYLLNLSFIPLLHFKAFLLKLEIAITLLLKFLFKQALDFLDFLVVILLDFSHGFLVLLLLKVLLVLQVLIPLLQILDVVVFLSARLFFLLSVSTLVLGQLGLDFALRGIELGLQLFLLLLPFLHFDLLDEYDVG